MSRLRLGLICCVMVTALLTYSASTFAKNLYVQMVTSTAGADYIKKQFIPVFEQKYGVKVDFETVTWGNREQKLYVTTAGGNPPDVFMSGAEHILSLVKNNLLESIDSQFDSLSDKSDFFPPALGSSQWQGHQYGIPIYTAPRIFWYRTDLFEQSGLDPSRPPKNWDEFLGATKRLTRTDGTKVTRVGYDLSRWTGTSHTANIQDFIIFLMQNGGRIANPDTFEAEFANQAGMETMEFMFNLRDASQPPGFNVDPGKGSGSRLFQGISAMKLDTLTAVRDFSNPNLDPSLAQYMRAITPPPGQKNRISLVFSDWLGIHKQSPMKDIAWLFIKEYTSAANLRDFNLSAGYLSPRRSTTRDFVRKEPLVTWVYETLNYCVPYPVFPDSENAAKAFNEGYMAVMQGKQAMQTAMGESARKWNLLMKDK